jgi:hypothetical protein
VTTDEQGQWSQLAGENAANPPPLTATKRAKITRELHPGGFDQVPLPARMTVPGIWVYGRRAVPTRPRRAPRRCGPVRDSGARTSRSSCSPTWGTACSMCRRSTRARCRPYWRGSTSTCGRAEPRGRDPVESPPSSGHHTAQARHAEQPRRALMIAGLAVTEGDEARRRRDRQPGVPSPSQGRRCSMSGLTLATWPDDLA